jgi:predicted DCC family thiol-disulfide oxidoreductase YuxK
MTARATLLYDAGCGFCDGSVRWLAARDRRGVFRLVPRASEEGERELRAAGVDAAQVDSVVLIRGGRAWTRSDAVLESLRLVGGPWALLSLARLVPRRIRDAAYLAIARRRHTWSAHPRRGAAASRRPQG